MNVLNTTGWNSAYAKGHTFEWLYDWLVARTDSWPPSSITPTCPAAPRRRTSRLPGAYQGTERGRLPGRDLEFDRQADLRADRAEDLGTGMEGGPHGGHRRSRPLRRREPDAAHRRPGRATHHRGDHARLKARRVYATLEPRLHVEFTLNGFLMGTALASRPSGDLTAKLLVNDPGGSVLSRVDILAARLRRQRRRLQGGRLAPGRPRSAHRGGDGPRRI